MLTFREIVYDVGRFGGMDGEVTLSLLFQQEAGLDNKDCPMAEIYLTAEHTSQHSEDDSTRPTGSELKLRWCL